MSKWHTKIWKGPGKGPGERWSGAMAGIVQPGKLAEGILGKDMSYGTLFAYLYRRFGPPPYGCDEYKEIANWVLTTPQKGIVLIVSPRPSGTRCSFGYCLRRDMAPDGLDEKKMSIINKALSDAIADLLTPTYVRDENINALGKCADGLLPVAYFKWAGYGVDHKYFELSGPNGAQG